MGKWTRAAHEAEIAASHRRGPDCSVMVAEAVIVETAGSQEGHPVSPPDTLLQTTRLYIFLDIFKRVWSVSHGCHSLAGVLIVP